MIATAMVRGTSVVDVVADRAYVITKTEVKCKMHMSGNFMRYSMMHAIKLAFSTASSQL